MSKNVKAIFPLINLAQDRQFLKVLKKKVLRGFGDKIEIPRQIL